MPSINHEDIENQEASNSNRAIKAQVNYKESVLSGIELNLSDVEYHAEAIAKIAQTLGGIALESGSNEVELGSLKYGNGLNNVSQGLQQEGININNLNATQIKELVELVSGHLNKSSMLTLK